MFLSKQTVIRRLEDISNQISNNLSLRPLSISVLISQVFSITAHTFWILVSYRYFACAVREDFIILKELLKVGSFCTAQLKVQIFLTLLRVLWRNLVPCMFPDGAK